MGSVSIAELTFWAVAGWCMIGTLGTVTSFKRKRRAEALRHGVWLIAVMTIYFAALLIVSTVQKQRVLAIGQDQCFRSMCFRVTGVDEVPGLVAGSTDRVIRVRIAIRNLGSSPAEQSALRAYLLDAQGREWDALPGLSGNRLTARVGGGAEVVSQPMFRVARDATGLGLVFTHGSWQTRRLILGDSDSLGHKRTIVRLGR